MNDHESNIKGAVENPIMGRPFVVVALDKSRYAVRVIQHARNFNEATDTVDDMTEDPANIEYVIVEARGLTRYLADARSEMAVLMDKTLMSD